MPDFRDTTGLARVATIALIVYMILGILVAFVMLGNPELEGPAAYIAVTYFVVLLACFVLVGRWIYVTNANAHLVSDTMTITPGWAVGWFFVPFANLVMPFRGVKETWRASHEGAGFEVDVETPLLGWWWGLWVTTNILDNLSARLGDSLAGGAYLDLFVAALNVPLCLILIQLIRRLTRVQLTATQGSVFA